MGKQMRQGKPMTRPEADAMRRPRSEQEIKQRRQAMRDRQRAGRETPGPVRVDEQTDEVT